MKTSAISPSSGLMPTEPTSISLLKTGPAAATISEASQPPMEKPIARQPWMPWLSTNQL